MEKYTKTIANNIKKNIEKSGLTQVEIVAKMNSKGCKVNQGQISKWASGATMPRINTCAVLANVLGCELKDILKF